MSRHLDAALDLIDNALADYATSDDAMRWTPEPQPEPSWDSEYFTIVLDRVSREVYEALNRPFSWDLIVEPWQPTGLVSFIYGGSTRGGKATVTVTPSALSPDELVAIPSWDDEDRYAKFDAQADPIPVPPLLFTAPVRIADMRPEQCRRHGEPTRSGSCRRCHISQ